MKKNEKRSVRLWKCLTLFSALGILCLIVLGCVMEFRFEKQLPDDFDAIYQKWKAKEMSADEAARLCDMGISTFYRKVKELGL